MSNIEKAQKAKVELSLAKLINFRGEVMNRRQFVERLISLGGVLQVVEEPTIKYNRIKYNQMDEAQQKDWKKKEKASIKPVFRVSQPDGCSTALTKTEADYFLLLTK
jgi:hypothetical protein